MSNLNNHFIFCKNRTFRQIEAFLVIKTIKIKKEKIIILLEFPKKLKNVSGNFGGGEAVLDCKVVLQIKKAKPQIGLASAMVRRKRATRE